MNQRIEVKYIDNAQAGIRIFIYAITPDQPVQHLINGKWQTVRREDDLELILKWGKSFDTISDAEHYVKTNKLFKRVLLATIAGIENGLLPD